MRVTRSWSAHWSITANNRYNNGAVENGGLQVEDDHGSSRGVTRVCTVVVFDRPDNSQSGLGADATTTLKGAGASGDVKCGYLKFWASRSE